MSAQQTDLNWRTIAEFTLPASAGCVRSAVEQVAAAVKEFNLAPARLEQLTRAVSEAMQNTLVQSDHLQVDLPLRIRVLLSVSADQHVAYCWGFFLIAGTADQLLAADSLAHHTFDLYLYQEGA